MAIPTANDCSHLPGRLRHICEGRAGLSLAKVNKYRAGWGLPPLTSSTDRKLTTAQRIASAASVMGKTALSAVTTGQAYASPEVRAARLAICQTCEHFAKGTCSLCGCACNGKASFANKLAHASSVCPATIPKWGPVEGAAKPAKLASIAESFRHTSKETPRFVTTATLMDDCKRLASMIPADASRIVGVSRSGLCPASMIAMLLHLPLSIVRQSTADIVDGGNGWRLSGNTGGAGPVIVIDDTVMSGNSFKHVMPIVRKTHPNAISAAVYCNPAARVKPDMHAVDLPWPHILEWNVFNSVLTPQCAVDFDGILCHDCQPGDDDDGPKYAEFIKNAKPLYPVRKVVLPLIVTARIERYRAETVEWLKRHGIAVKKLVMHPAKTLRERQRDDIAAFKANHYAGFLKQRHTIKPPLFIESDPGQAARIAKITGGIVACPAAGRCYP